MVHPDEMKLERPMELYNGVFSTTLKVWEILVASRAGELQRVKDLVAECPELAFAQYNYVPPIHLAVQEGHVELVEYLLELGAHDPSYRTYPFLEHLETLAADRNYADILLKLETYADNPALHKYKGDNGRIIFDRTPAETAFQMAVEQLDFAKTESLLKENPGFVGDTSFFWGEGILTMPAKAGDRPMVELLLEHGAKVPDVSKWARFYYFKHFEIARFLMERGMNPDHKSWQEVSLLHDMAQSGDVQKAGLLIEYGAQLDTIEEQYYATPLGMAARWGRTEMVAFLLQQGADPNKAGVSWARPLAWAKKKGHSAIIELLENAGAE